FSEAAGPDAQYVAPDDASQMAKTIQQVISDKTLKQQMIDRSYQYIQKFSETRIAAEMTTVYQALM
ncbi:MAG: glycosyltransferase family 1 protein, partial [Cytophagia bacterium]|nr:glycosyltransferase family 1 protein [Cytophagia bacterium]